MSQRQVIGLGTWMDKLASRLVEREKRLGRSLELLRTEAGIAASGIVHLGSMADSVRAHAVALALKNLGYNSETIQFADDMDGLRSVPAELPREVGKYLLHPVSLIPDPFNCHGSYAEHMEYLLLDALEKAGIRATFMRAYDAYKSGILAEQIRKILKNHKAVGEKINELTGQKKFLDTLPYFPICGNCGRVYTAYAYKFESGSGKVLYRCKGVTVKGVWHEGCGYEGEADIKKADGKLSWKVEWAARWAALDIRFEAYGKDLANSIMVNDWVSREILQFEPPMHVQYELFLDESKRKISKSRGVSVFTPQSWYRYGTPQSLILLLLKRIKGTRVISPPLIPALMNELDRLQDAYYSGSGDIKSRGLFMYIYNLEPPREPPSKVPYTLLTQLAGAAPDGAEEQFVISRLQRYGYKVDDTVRERVRMAINFVKDFGQVEVKPVQLSENQKKAINELIKVIEKAGSGDEIQNGIFNAARNNGLQPAEFFRTLYEVLIGQPRGPRLGPYIFEDLGRERTIEKLREAVGRP